MLAAVFTGMVLKPSDKLVGRVLSDLLNTIKHSCLFIKQRIVITSNN